MRKLMMNFAHMAFGGFILVMRGIAVHGFSVSAIASAMVLLGVSIGISFLVDRL